MTDERKELTLREPERDPALAQAIRAAENRALGLGAESSDARLELLRARIARATAAELEAWRERPWWEWTTRWALAEVALGAAAGIAALLVATVIGSMRPEEASDRSAEGATATVAMSRVATTGVDSLVRRAVASGASSEQVLNALIGPVNGDWLLAAAVTR